MPYLLLRLAINAAVLGLVSVLVPGIHVAGFFTAVAGVAVLGLLNAVLRPLLVLLTLPVTFISLGLFLFVINAATFGLAAHLVPGFTIDGFGPALLGSALYSLAGTLTTHYLRPPGQGPRGPAGPRVVLSMGTSRLGTRGGRSDVIEGEAYDTRDPSARQS